MSKREDKLPGVKLTETLKSHREGKISTRKALAIIELKGLPGKKEDALRGQIMLQSQKDKPIGRKEVERAIIKGLKKKE